jgi:para-nitrobenzyl esterase
VKLFHHAQGIPRRVLICLGAAGLVLGTSAVAVAASHTASATLASTAAAVAGSHKASTSTLASTAVASSASTCANGTLVQTDKGPVCGTTAAGVKQWLGVPFAAPPVGALRWEPPQPHAPWSQPWQAIESSNACPESYIVVDSLPSTNEDCLYLDIVVPTDAGPGPLPVFFHIYGGGFTIGANALFNGATLATTEHAIVVGVNYRLGVFGFLADKALGPHSGDYGLEDQQAGLHWVQRNIAAFGGNPNNVTIFGESAGGSSVCDQIASPTAAGLFQKGISVSGEYNSLLGAPTSLQPQDCKATLPTEAQADAVGASYAASLGCGSATNVAACLRNVPVRELLATETAGTEAPIVNGTTLTMSPAQAFATGHVNKVRAILGVGRDENLSGTATTAAQYTALVDAQYGSAAPAVLKLYPLRMFPSPFVAFRTVAADSDTVCPALVTASRLSKSIPLYEYQGDDTDAPLGNENDPTVPNAEYHIGGYYIFPDVNIQNPFNVTPLDANQQALANQELAQFGAFARTGDPSATGTPAWPQFSTASQLVMSWQPGGDDQLTTGSVISLDHNCGFWDQIAPKQP